MKLRIAVVLGLLFVASSSGDDHDRSRSDEKKDFREGKQVRAAPKDPVVGHWNVTHHSDHDRLCLKMDGGVRLEFTEKLKNGSTTTRSIVSDDYTTVDNKDSLCVNSSSDYVESIVLDFGEKRILTFEFSREHNITGDHQEQEWQLFRVTFKDRDGSMKNDKPLTEIVSTRGRSYGCTSPEPLKVNDKLTITLNSFRVQPFMTTNDYGQADWCAKEQTSDLIPIIIGAALAALVIIVLIAYLVGRARARTTTYDNI